jgi:hypothetical protein
MICRISCTGIHTTGNIINPSNECSAMLKKEYSDAMAILALIAIPRNTAHNNKKRNIIILNFFRCMKINDIRSEYDTASICLKF